MRVQANSLGGQIDFALAAGDATISSPALAAAPPVTAPDTLTVILDPNGMSGLPPEIVEITEHVGGSTTASITRGHEGTTARDHRVGTRWRHGPTALWAKEVQDAIESVVNPASGTYVDRVQRMGATALWPLADATGATVAADARGDMDLTILGAPLLAQATIQPDAALSMDFDGVDDGLDLPAAWTEAGLPANFSIAMWLRPDDVTTERVVLEIGDATNGKALAINAGRLHVLKTSGGVITANASAPIVTGAPVFVAATFDNEGGLYALYKDGVLVAADSDPALASVARGAGASGLFLQDTDGRYPSGATTAAPFDGKASGVAFWAGRILSDWEIRYLWDGSRSATFGGDPTTPPIPISKQVRILNEPPDPHPKGQAVLYDDSFRDAAKTGYTEVTPNGTTVWTEALDVMSAWTQSQTTAAACSLLTPRVIAPGEAVETRMNKQGPHGNYMMAGPIITNGTATTSECIWFMPYNGQIGVRRGTLANITTILNEHAWNIDTSTPVFMRLRRDLAGAWQASYSSDAVSWIDNVAVAYTLPGGPTHFGLAVSTWTIATTRMATFDYLRVYKEA